jgi:putative aldouronate transport system permease protein
VQAKGNAVKESTSDRGFEVTLTIFLVLVILVILIPLWYLLMISLTPLGMQLEGLFLSPFDWSYAAYKQLLTQDTFLKATFNSLVLTVSQVGLSMALTVPMAFVMASKTLPGRKIFLALILFTFLFNPGFIPTYLLIKDLGLLNTYPGVILPGAVSVYNLIVMMAFFQNLPESLEEAARIDGANELQILFRIVLPLSKPILLTIGLFYAVTQWNDYFGPLLYLNDKALMPLPVILKDILSGANLGEFTDSTAALNTSSPESIRMAAVLLALIPMLLIYPWIQRYFTKGVLLGGIKE